MYIYLYLYLYLYIHLLIFHIFLDTSEASIIPCDEIFYSLAKEIQDVLPVTVAQLSASC